MRSLLFAIFSMLLFGCQLQEQEDVSQDELWEQKKKYMEQMKEAEIEYASRLQFHLLADTIDLDSIEWLLAEGADPNIAVSFEYSYRYKRTGLNLPIIGPHISIGEMDMKRVLPALHSAIFRGGVNHEEAINMLLFAGSDPNVITEDEFEMTALDMCLRQDYGQQMIDHLMQNGADASKTSLDWAGDDLSTIDFLIKRGADPKTINLGAFIDKRYEWKSNFQKVLEYDIDPNNIHPKFFLDFPGLDKYVLETLLDNGLDLNKPLRDGSYLLCYVIYRFEDIQPVAYMLDKGARSCGETHPLIYARHRYKSYYPEILALIKSHVGADTTGF